MRKFVTSAVALASLAGVMAAPGLAQARHYWHHHYYRNGYYHSGYNRPGYNPGYYYSCARAQRRAANNGTLIGAIGGGILGNVVAGHHSKLGGTLIGAGVGGVAGHEIARNNHRC